MDIITNDNFKSEIIEQGEDVILRVNCENSLYTPSIEDNPVFMAFTINKLTESPSINKIVFTQKRDYEYSYSQVALIREIANLYSFLIKNKSMFSYRALLTNPSCRKCINGWTAKIQEFIIKLLKNDPIGCYVELKRTIREERILKEKASDNKGCESCRKKYISILAYILNSLEKTKLINISKAYLPGYVVGTRDVYRRIFNPTIKPDFMFTKLMASYPTDGEEIDSYNVGDAEVIIFKLPGNVQTLFHITPPEFKLSEDKYELLDLARKIMAEHKPKHSEFVDPKRMRQVFFNIGIDLLEELANYKKINLKPKELKKLTEILVRYTVGFGLVEVLLEDKKVQDISINSPLGRIPIFIVHQDYDDCVTNIIPTEPESESWASKFRMISGRPLDEANPILDTELEIPSARARVAVIGRPLNPTGLAYSIRRHRDKPWTLPLFVNNKTMNATAAGLFSFLIDGTRAMLIAGTRSSGKSSLLSSFLVEIMRRYRIITIEDTLELPVGALRDLGFNIQSMKVASAFAHTTSEVNASDGIRTTLRLGDSSLIVGEVRSKEAIALYEAMRVGAAANVVAGTIHGDSPYGVFDRVVNDIGVPKTSFKATDIIITANPIKSADGLHKKRRILGVTEVRKKWNEDPMKEGAFVDLLKYHVKEDELIVTPDLENGDSEILKTIAGNIKEFAGDWDALWDNIMLRAKTKQTLVDYARKMKNFDILEADFVLKTNDAFHNIADDVRQLHGALDPKRIFFNWKDWLKRELKKI